MTDIQVRYIENIRNGELKEKCFTYRGVKYVKRPVVCQILERV